MRVIDDYDKITDIEWGGIDHNDYPDYCDAYITYAKYDGEDMTEEEIESLDRYWLHEKLWDHLY